MSAFTGFASAALQLGLETVLIKPAKRGLFNIKTSDNQPLPDISAQATVSESHHDVLEITEHPIELGAAISDHCFKRPVEITIEMAWSNSPTSKKASLIGAAVGAVAVLSPIGQTVANAAGMAQSAMSLLNGVEVDQVNYIYEKLQEIQNSRALFDVYTGRRRYRNMVCRSLSVRNDFRAENSLFVTMECREVILVRTQTVVLSKETQAQLTAKDTASPVQKGTAQVGPGKQ